MALPKPQIIGPKTLATWDTARLEAYRKELVAYLQSRKYVGNPETTSPSGGVVNVGRNIGAAIWQAAHGGFDITKTTASDIMNGPDSAFDQDTKDAAVALADVNRLIPLSKGKEADKADIKGATLGHYDNIIKMSKEYIALWKQDPQSVASNQKLTEIQMYLDAITDEDELNAIRTYAAQHWSKDMETLKKAAEGK